MFGFSTAAVLYDKRGARASTENWFHPFSVFAKYLGTKHHNGLY